MVAREASLEEATTLILIIPPTITDTITDMTMDPPQAAESLANPEVEMPPQVHLLASPESLVEVEAAPLASRASPVEVTPQAATMMTTMITTAMMVITVMDMDTITMADTATETDPQVLPESLASPVVIALDHPLASPASRVALDHPPASLERSHLPMMDTITTTVDTAMEITDTAMVITTVPQVRLALVANRARVAEDGRKKRSAFVPRTCERSKLSSKRLFNWLVGWLVGCC